MILVTGATGLVGSHLILELAKQHSTIRALYRTTIPYTHNAIEWFQADILDIVALEEAMDKVDNRVAVGWP